MSNLVLLNLQFVVALGVYVVIYRIYFQSWLAAQPFGPAVLPFLLINAFRYMGLALIVPGQMESTVSIDALTIMAWGDFASGFCALWAAIAVHHRWSVSTALVALFSVVGIADLIVVGIKAMETGIFFTDMGTMWFVLVVFAPLMLLAQLYVPYRLLRHLGGR